jgi:hypothetical protein
MRREAGITVPTRTARVMVLTLRRSPLEGEGVRRLAVPAPR